MRGLTIYFFATASYVGGALSGLISIFLGVLVYSWRKRITFSKKLLSLVMANVSKYPAVFMMGIIGMIIVSALTTLLLISVFGWFLIVTNALGDSSSTNPISGSGNSPMPASQIYAILAFFFFTFFWSMQVMKHIIHMTVAGVLAKDYFLNALNNDMHVVMSRAGANAVAMSAFKLALTKSFGSVCLGSLFISIVGVWRAVIRSVLLGGRSKAAGSYERWVCSMNGCTYSYQTKFSDPKPKLISITVTQAFLFAFVSGIPF